VKLVCSQQELHHGLSVVGRAISTRSTLPILSNIHVSTDQGRLRLAATNLEIGIRIWVEAQVQAEGVTTLPAKTITELVSSLHQDQVELTMPEDAHTVNIKCLGVNAIIKGMDPSEFPLIPGVEEAQTLVVFDVVQLKSLIEQVTIAAASDDSRPVFTGVHVEIANERATFAAADAFRLAVGSIVLPGQPDLDGSLLIPARTLMELARILPSEGQVEMMVSPNRSQVLFHTEHVEVVTRLIEGNFPNFRAILPKEHTTRAVIETKEFAAAVKTVTPFARDSSNITRVKVSGGTGDGGEPGTLVIEATAEDVGSNVSTINASVDGPEQQIIFNVKYLADVLAVLDTPEVVLELVSGARPGVVRPVSTTDYTYVIMPMSTNR
jgi:DNA polymerase-3 subunit beta